MSERNGPEWAPIREFIKTFPIRVSIFDKDDKLIREEKLDYGKREDREWLGRLSFWSWNNGHSVETSKNDD